MSKSVIGLVVATLTCGTASAYLWQELRDERAQTQALQARVTELEQAHVPAPSEAYRPIAPAPEPIAESIEATPAAPKTATAAVVAPAPTATWAVAGPNVRNGRMDPDMQRRMQESFEQQRAMLKDPEYRELMRAQQKMGMRRMYGDMETMLGLSKAESERVMDVLAEQQVRSMEQRPYVGMDGTQPDQAAIREQQRMFEEAKRKNDAELAAALGPKYGEWQEYQQSMWSRSQVMRLKETLAGTDDPLRQDQIRPLVQVLAREQTQMSTARAESPNRFSTPDTQLRMQEEWLERTAQSHERIRNAVSSLLSPTQLQQLQDQQDQERKMQELNLRMQRARAAEAQARGEDPAAEAQFGGSAGVMIMR